MKTSKQCLRMVGKPALNLCPYGSDGLMPVRQAWWMLPVQTEPIAKSGVTRIYFSTIDLVKTSIEPKLLKELSHGYN